MIDQETFEQIAHRDIKGEATEEEAAWLRSEENAQDFRDAIGDLLRDVDTQLAERAAALQQYRNECFRLGEDGKQVWFDGLAQYETWRAGAIRVKTSCQKRLGELKRLARRKYTEEHESSPLMINRQVRDELHRMRRVLAAIAEEYGIEDFDLFDWQVELSSHPYARLERNESDNGWTVLIEYPEAGEAEGGAA